MLIWILCWIWILPKTTDVEKMVNVFVYFRGQMAKKNYEEFDFFLLSFSQEILMFWVKKGQIQIWSLIQNFESGSLRPNNNGFEQILIKNTGLFKILPKQFVFRAN